MPVPQGRKSASLIGWKEALCLPAPCREGQEQALCTRRVSAPAQGGVCSGVTPSPHAGCLQQGPARHTSQQHRVQQAVPPAPGCCTISERGAGRKPKPRNQPWQEGKIEKLKVSMIWQTAKMPCSDHAATRMGTNLILRALINSNYAFVSRRRWGQWP